jgi:hypothetical protein
MGVVMYFNFPLVATARCDPDPHDRVPKLGCHGVAVFAQTRVDIHGPTVEAVELSSELGARFNPNGLPLNRNISPAITPDRLKRGFL